jgi:hypothetical protein
LRSTAALTAPSRLSVLAAAGNSDGQHDRLRQAIAEAWLTTRTTPNAF